MYGFDAYSANACSARTVGCMASSSVPVMCSSTEPRTYIYARRIWKDDGDGGAESSVSVTRPCT
ncbi:MAG: hypothetical protein BWY76_00594 [bacterium ADurb.Bin429]|nr:MAG: hypothetical protein BWY76_00594 [bacterium ADurb.Bin429]